MRYLSMVWIDETCGQKPSEQLMHDMGKLIEDWTRNGTHGQFGPMSPEKWLEWYGPHAHDHADQIRRARAAAHG